MTLAIAIFALIISVLSYLKSVRNFDDLDVMKHKLSIFHLMMKVLVESRLEENELELEKIKKAEKRAAKKVVKKAVKKNI